jgi:hypothetical protein
MKTNSNLSSVRPSLIKGPWQILLLACLLVATGLAHATNAVMASLSQGLLIHLPFDGNIVNQGSLPLVAQRLPPAPRFVGGPVGYAYQFTIPPDGLQSTGSHFIWNAPMALAANQISVSCWLKTGGSTDPDLDFFGVESPQANWQNLALVYSLGYDTVFKNGALGGSVKTRFSARCSAMFMPRCECER